MNEDRLPIKTIILGWKDNYGVTRISKLGTPFIIIPSNNHIEAFRALAQTLLDSGYTFQEINSPSVSIMLADICWREDKIRKMNLSEVRKAKLSFATDWNEVIHRKEFTGVVISKVNPDNRPMAEVIPIKKEKVLELDPSDRIKIDTSDLPDNPLDEDFLKELDSDE
jgi:hypothetical protein